MIIQWADSDKFIPLGADFYFMPRNHFLDMFLNPVPVIAKDGETYLTNSEAFHTAYKKKRKKIMYFSECGRSEEKLSKVGFLL